MKVLANPVLCGFRKSCRSLTQRFSGRSEGGVLGAVAGQHVVAGAAVDAVAGERAVGRQRRQRVVGRPGDGAGGPAQEGLALLAALAAAGAAVDLELPLSRDAVAAEAHALEGFGGLGMEGLGLARQLGVEDRVAAAETHRRGPPGGVGGEVQEVLAVRVGLRHVELQAGGPRVVAAEALRGGHELARRGDGAGLHPHLVVGLRGERHDRLPARPRQAAGGERAGDRAAVEVVRLAEARRVVGGERDLAVVAGAPAPDRRSAATGRPAAPPAPFRRWSGWRR